MKQIYILLILSLLNNGVYSQQGNSLNFDGTNDYVSLPNESNFDFTNQLSIELLVKSSAAPQQWDALIAKGDNTWRIALSTSGTVAFAGTGAFIDFFSTTSVTDGLWHHVAATYDGTQAKIYIDGVLEATKNATSNINNSNFQVFIGENQQRPNRHYNGNIDEVRIWNIVRTATEINDNKLIELTLPQTGLVAYYQFNQGIANGNNSTETTLNDELNTNNGTLNNFALTGTSSNWIGDNVLSIDEISLFEKNIILYPNPSSNFIQIFGLTTTTNYKIYNIIGAEINNGEISDNEKIDTHNLTNGIYFLKVENRNTLKFIKK